MSEELRRALRRALAVLTTYAAHQDLCRDIVAVLKRAGDPDFAKAEEPRDNLFAMLATQLRARRKGGSGPIGNGEAS